MGGRILVIDDDPRLIHIVSMFLDSEGHTIQTASNGAEGLELLKSFRPELVIVDVMMPDMDGTEVCRSIRADPEFGDIPVLLFTALSTAADVERARAAGATNMITKPYSLEGLKNVVNGALARSSALPSGEAAAGS